MKNTEKEPSTYLVVETTMLVPVLSNTILRKSLAGFTELLFLCFFKKRLEALQSKNKHGLNQRSRKRFSYQWLQFLHIADHFRIRDIDVFRPE